MGKILSQEEIDALINDAKRGTDLEKLGEVKRVVEYLYDWKNPSKINTEHKRQLKQIFQIFATSLSTYLQTSLKSIIDIELTDISNVAYSDYLLSIAEPTCMYKLYIDKFKAHSIIEVQPAFSFYLIDRLLGGTGKTFDLSRAITDIEKSIMLKIMQVFFTSLKDAWRAQMPGLNFQYNGFESNPNFVNITSPTDVVGVFEFEISIKDDLFNFTICFPSRVLDPILEKLSAQSWQDIQSIKEANVNLIEDYIKFSEVEAVVIIGDTELSVEELTNLKEGDVLKLDSLVDNPLLIEIDGRPKYYVKPGVEGTKKAVEFIRALTPVEERTYVR